MRFLRTLAVSILVAGAVAFLSSNQVAYSQSTGVLNPQVTTFSSPNSNASTQIIGSNPSRKLIQICNPSAVVVWIAPGTTAASANGAGNYGLPAVSSGTTVCYTTPTVPGAQVGAGNNWNAVGASTPYTLSIFEYN